MGNLYHDVATKVKPGIFGKFLGRWGWPLMGLFAAAPVLAHALDWKSRAKAKQKAKEEAMRLRQQHMSQLPHAQGGAMTYKMAAFSRNLRQAPNKSTSHKLDAIQQAMMKAKMDVPRKAGHGAPSQRFRAPAN